MVAGDLPPPAAARNGAARAEEAAEAANDPPTEQDLHRDCGRRKLQILYLFAGARRKSGLAGSLHRAAANTGIHVQVREVDVLQGGQKNNLLRPSLRQKLMEEINSGAFYAVIASPPCSTFSRARHARTPGPRPVRSRDFPRGLPVLGAQARETTRAANDLVDFTVRALAAQAQHEGGLLVLEHPEDLGVCREGGDPGAIWQWPKSRSCWTTREYRLGRCSSRTGTCHTQSRHGCFGAYRGWTR